MTAATGDEVAVRHRSLDTIRGFAVMGILLMNIVAFAMPEMAYVSPAVYGSDGPADYWAWTAMFIAVDGKMRGLFSVLFGASMLLVYERAQQSAGNGRAVHVRRMLCLLVFGLIHFYLIWFGDILVLYALCGLLGTFVLTRETRWLKRAMIVFFTLHFLVMAGLSLAMLAIKWAATQPGATLETMTSYRETLTEIAPGGQAIAQEIALFRGDYLSFVRHNLTESLFHPLEFFLQGSLETMGLIALGIILFRNGFLTGQWSRQRYRRAMLLGYSIGVPPLAALAAWVWSSGFDPFVVLGTFIAWSMPFRIAVMLGHAALLMLVIQRFAESGALERVEAAGKAAFSNYLGTSILMTGLFYGWGLGWFGRLSRWQCLLVVPFVWLLMLLWSKPWLERFRYGPLEWLWRSLARGEVQAMRKSSIAIRSQTS